MGGRDALHEQLESLHAISVEIAALRDMAEIHGTWVEDPPDLMDLRRSRLTAWMSDVITPSGGADHPFAP